MKTKTTYILLTIAILIAGYIYFIDTTMPTSDQREAAGKKVFGLLKAEDIGHIEINAPNAAQMTLVGGANTTGPTTPTRIAIICAKTTANEWLMTQPVNTRADRSVLENITSQLAGLEKRETLKETGNAATYGLDYPTITIAFTAKDKSYLVKLGRAAPMDLGVYMAVEGRPEFYIVHKSFAELLNKPVADFRHKKIFDTSSYDMTSLRFIHPDKTIELQKAGEQWWLLKPVADMTDKNKISEILTQMGTLVVSNFVADNETSPAIYGLDKPALKVVVPDPKDPNKSETLLIGREQQPGKFIAMKEDAQTIFTIEKAPYDLLATPLDAMRNKNAFELVANNINRIEMKSKQNTVLSLDKNNSEKAWQFVYPSMTVTGQAPADVDSFIDKLNSSMIEQFTADTATDLAAYGLAEPFSGLELILGSASVAKEDRLLLGLVKGAPYVYLKRPDNPKIVALSNSLYEYLKQGSLLFRRKSLMDVTSDKVKKISIASGKNTYVYEQSGPQNWTMTAPQKRPIEKSSELNTLMLEFCHLSASEFVADLNFSPDLLAYGLDKPEAIVTLAWSDKDNEVSGKTIQIGHATGRSAVADKKTDEHYYARFADDVIIFKISAGLVDAVNKILETSK